MTGQEATTIVAEMAATWPQREVSGPEAALWRDTLAPWPLGMVRRVIATLRAESEWFPTHATFTERIKDLDRRQGNERQLPAPRTCEMCGNTGWVEFDATSFSVRRCGCSKGRPPADHPHACSCARCRYGTENYALYMAGKAGSL